MNRYKYVIAWKNGSTQTGAMYANRTADARKTLMKKYGSCRDFLSLSVWQAGKCE